jgi:polygalacturonase
MIPPALDKTTPPAPLTVSPSTATQTARSRPKLPVSKILQKTGGEGGYPAFALIFAVLIGCATTLTAHAQSCSFTLNAAASHGEDIQANTALIQHNIDLASKCTGTVAIESGTFRIGSLFIKSGVTLRLEKGATLLGSQNIKDYPEMPTRVAGLELTWPAALINVYKQSNVIITGEGTIDGDGKVFWDSYWALRKIDEPKGLRWASDYDAKRPRLIQIFDSSSVKLGGGLQLHRSGFWTVHICYSHDITVDGVTIVNNIGGRGPSTDGIDIDSSNHIDVSHADISVNDDALCLKAGRDSDGLRVNRPTTDIKIHDNIVRDGAAGITFGSETSGGFRNIEVWNITAQGHVPVGILFKSAHTRGGFADDIRLHDMTFDGVTAVLRITMNWNPSYSYATIPPGLTNYPAYYKTLTTPVPEDKGRARVSNVHIWNVTATNAKTAFEVDAYTQVPLEHFKLDHIDITAATAGHIADARDWTFSDVVLHTADHSTIALSDSTKVTGIVTHPGPPPVDDLATKPFAEQDKR